jgi:hypothetical protein
MSHLLLGTLLGLPIAGLVVAWCLVSMNIYDVEE